MKKNLVLLGMSGSGKSSIGLLLAKVTGLKLYDIDRLIEKQRVTTDQIERREIGFDVQRELLQLHLASNFVSERVISLQWPYLQEFPLDIGFSFQERLASCWIDQSHPTFFNR